MEPFKAVLALHSTKYMKFLKYNIHIPYTMIINYAPPNINIDMQPIML